MYAKIVKKMSIIDKITAEVEAEKFGIDIDKNFDCFEKPWKGGWAAVYFDNLQNDYVSASVVRCPNCGEIQVCFGEYGDPENEICICTKCHQNYDVEPF